MRFTGPLGYALSGSAVLALLAGCSGGGSSSSSMPVSPAASQLQASRSVESSTRQLPQNMLSTSVLRPGIVPISNPDRSAGFEDPDAKATASEIISDSGTNDVYVYGAAGKLVATITGFSEPQGLGADAAGDLFVADTGNSNILEYAAGSYKKVKATLTDAGQYPVGVGVSTAGFVGVTNIISTSDGAGSVSFYTKGKTTPCVTVSSSTFARVYFGAFDKAGDFFVDGEDANGSVVVGEIAKATCKSKTITTLKTSNAITFPGGIEVTPTGGIAIDDQEGEAIYTYKAPVKGSLGKPTSTTPLTGASDPVTFSFTKTATDVWTADAGLAASNEYKYPAGGSSIKSITGLSEPIGVVVLPAEVP